MNTQETAIVAVTTDSLAIGGELYELDGNSPLSASTTSSVTYTVSGTYDEVIVIPRSGLDEVGFDELQVNGDTGNNYDFVDNSDTQTTGSWPFDVPRARAVRWYHSYDRD